ncbi:MAG: MarR family winged helix-turn-helix transcriptional regulator [Alphaproteobacteria bacterium]|uniref:MarR family winged helix-turn-helix transcriptional regulator n=1 Tax=Brevundimonas sp. TaxID=1871086 RepID=UPI001836D291|nr:MarR family winged helix-turn-helix transcriptional regulator [Brevundimonas sp.]MBA3051164.1 winged helix-turn-helix transcriptional regulator [Brevundimonas sp.]MBU3971522.1 MarR family winged helix-turn-helix transcriptional regulator [Alphaproteobacteria bacterium]MBU3974655.1 MarR family winged helix-turn-helix transcriptional regulator [Alphaproteobacteria bacterium]MBU4134959.1 MarR family winged helix-turn-helix transcriptional regulator [Alphaproteobacteria bacterium]
MSNPAAYATTLHIKDHCLCLHAQRAARTLARRFDEAFRPLGITSGQFSLMNGLNRPEPPTIGAVAALLAMDRSTVTANLKPLERAGLATVSVDAKDRRGRRAALTDAGRALLAAATPVWVSEHAVVEAALGRDADELRAGLRAVG